MSRYLLLVLLSLLGCAGPAQYERGTMRPPARAPTFNPTTDSPNPYGHPQPQVPRSPYTRVLPQTPETRKEPGIWATNPPAPEGPSISILGVPIPLPDDATPMEVAEALRCSQNTHAAVMKALEHVPMPNIVKRCTALHAQHDCLTARWNQRNRDEATRKIAFPPNERRALDRLLKIAWDRIVEDCGGVNQVEINQYRAAIGAARR